MTSLLRVSVVAEGRRLDLAVPPALPVAEIVPGVARRLGVVSYAGLRLCTATGSVLDDAAGLVAQHVPDGAVLALAPPPPPPVVHDDVVEALSVPSEEPSEWPGRPVEAAGAVLLALGAASLAVAHETRAAAVSALLLLAASLVLARAVMPLAAAVGAAASAYAAVAAALLATDLRPGAGVAWAASGGGALAVGVIVMAGLPAQRLRLLPVLVVGATSAVVGAVLSFRTVPSSTLAPVLLVLVLLLAAALPWLVVGRISRPRGRVDPDRLDEEVRLARELLAGLSAGLGVVQVVLVGAVAGDGIAGVCLAGVASALAVLRARHHVVAVERLPGLLTGTGGAVVAAAVTLVVHESWRPAGALVLAGAGGVLLLGRALPFPEAIRAPVLQALESFCLVALLPLLVLATGALEVLP